MPVPVGDTPTTATTSEFYKKVREVFNLDQVDKLLRAQQAAEGK